MSFEEVLFLIVKEFVEQTRRNQQDYFRKEEEISNEATTPHN